MSNINKLHEKYNIYPEKRNFHLTYKLDMKSKIWQFVGYKCTKCQRTLTKDTSIPKHELNCRGIIRNREIDGDVTVLTVTGEVWQPYDSNQN